MTRKEQSNSALNPTRDVDVAVVVNDDADFEALVFALRASGPLIDLPGVGQLPIARSEELLAMKVLS